MMSLITSPHNPRLKELRKLRSRRERSRSGLFAVEGEDLVLAAQAAGLAAVEGFRAAGSPPLISADPAAQAFKALHAERVTPSPVAGFHEVDPDLLRAVSTLGSGARAIAVYEQRWGAAVGPLCVYLHGVGDPGNVGAVLRSAYAFGASCVALGPRCADPHSPKALRASMGAVFGVALARVSDVAELPGERVALVAGRGEPLWRVCGAVDRRGEGEADVVAGEADMVAGMAPTCARTRAHVALPGEHIKALTLLVGAEREGLPEEVVARCEHIAHIPIAGDSLNAAMAATVALYEIAGRSTRVPS
jgi:RNA methyltransferase, TrmH family